MNLECFVIKVAKCKQSIILTKNYEWAHGKKTNNKKYIYIQFQIHFHSQSQLDTINPPFPIYCSYRQCIYQFSLRKTPAHVGRYIGVQTTILEQENLHYHLVIVKN
jgi:hypothetical protein